MACAASRKREQAVDMNLTLRPWRRSGRRHGLGEHAGHQQARQGARPHDTGIVPAARRLGDRIKRAIAAVHESVHVR
jgi:hypothetical protein